MQSTSGFSASSDNSTTLTECQLAAKTAYQAAENAKIAGYKCHALVEIMEVAIVEIQKQVYEFSQKEIIESQRGETSPYFTLAEKHVQTLRRKSEGLQEVGIYAFQAAVDAIENAGVVLEVEGEECLPHVEKAKVDAYSSKTSADAAMMIAYKVEHSALRNMKTALADLKNTAYELEDNSENCNESNQRCENGKRNTRVAHVAAVFVGVAVLASLALFEVGSDPFYAVLCLGVVILGWAAIYWGRELYRKCCRTQTVTETKTILKEEYLDHIDERWHYLQEYFRNHDVSLTPSESDTDADS